MSNSERKEMIKNLKQFVVPVLRKLNFKGSFPYFRRLTSERINLLTFQFDKWGGGFVIEIANYKLGSFITHWGLEIPPDKLKSYYLNKRKRIQSNMTDPENSSTEDWFRYDNKYWLLTSTFGF